MKNKYLLLMLVLLPILCLIVVSCGGRGDVPIVPPDTPQPFSTAGTVFTAIAPTLTPLNCQIPEDWENAGKFIELRDSTGKVLGSLQLFIDEERGVLLLEGHEPVYFPPGSKGKLTIGDTTTEFIFGCDHNFYFPPGTIQAEPSQ